MAEVVEETINRIKGSVKGVIIVNYNGGIVRTTFESNKKESTSQIIQARIMQSIFPSWRQKPET